MNGEKTKYEECVQAKLTRTLFYDFYRKNNVHFRKVTCWKDITECRDEIFIDENMVYENVVKKLLLNLNMLT